MMRDKMNILVTGNNGYIGSILTELLLRKGYRVIGFDANYYNGCEFNEFNYEINQISKDIRNISVNDLRNVDAIIHLSALSNDPLGEFDSKLTFDINYQATVKLATIAKKLGIRRFLYASSCSMYGIAGEEEVTENSPLSPITAYAISKVKSEEALSEMANDSFSPVFLRPSTAYGLAPMLRCDIVLNNLVGWAYTTGKIRIMSDGTPWRPAVHVEDLANAFISCLEAPIEVIHNEAFNIGQNKENYRVRDMANIVKEVVPNCEIEYTYEHGQDSRTYRVNFDKIATKLKGYFIPKWDAKKGAVQLYKAFKKHGLTYDEFVGTKYIRLNQLKKLVENKKLNKNLFWN
jgi:nucleoside-diphosphate-sugar epimerase